ncbi:ankyrin repeat domain-containing protein, chloroplastic [Cajanus cajan]|uniref:Uncharacterized protein n=1 Tax=Cajanus cajan TaxID=3821 RepID=A0A151THY6_CAJCA|nr:ankyrin repeat domain-containing protein, chloroplastic [Cajanus cajan]KYP66642.1 hypothetical protein KK1_012944 [Cajanus cajan]
MELIEGSVTIFPFSTVTLFPHKFFSSATTPRHFLKFPTKWNAHSQNIGDSVVFEEGIFEDDTVFPNDTDNRPKPRPKKKPVLNTRENLVPDKWRRAQAESIITVNERRKNKRRDLVPLRDVKKFDFYNKGKKGSKPFRDINWDEYKASKKDKLKQLNPLLLKNPSTFPVEHKVPEPDFKGERVEPKNPRGVVHGKGLEDVIHFFNSWSYNPSANITHEGRRKLFTITKEEMFLLNKPMPDLAAATSGNWLPLHTLAACGEFYLLHSLLKHNVDINAVDKDGLTVLHKAIGKKQAITNYLLRNSANPFVQDKEGATLMHYAVQTASTETIELLLLNNVDINLQDNDGWTPLHLAVQTQRPNLVRLLLLKGANKTLRNKDGLTPLDLCLYSGQSFQTYVIIKLLKLPQGCL